MWLSFRPKDSRTNIPDYKGARRQEHASRLISAPTKDPMADTLDFGNPFWYFNEVGNGVG